MTQQASADLDDGEVMALLQRVARQDEAAFKRLYAAMSRRVYAFALLRLRDPAAAAEVVSETLFEVWRKPTAFRGDSRFSTWLLGIARHKLLTKLQARSRPDEQHDDIDDQAELLEADTPDGFAALADQQRRAGVAACLEKLPELHRECLHLVYFEGLGVSEVAAVQSVPEGTIKTRLFHARAKIKQCLQNLLTREGRAAPAAGGAA
jgi:RNA polymerase sigma-70 factor, ECF subfamily